MRIFVLILLTSWLSPSMVWGAFPQLTLTQLDGTVLQGNLQSLSTTEAQVETTEGVKSVAVSQIMQLEFEPVPEPASSVSVVSVHSIDSSLIQADSLTTDGTNAQLQISPFGQIEVPLRKLRDIRFASLDDKIAASWEDLRTRNTRDDLLIIRKEDVLDFVGGAVAKVTPESLTMIVKGRELTAPRERAFGLVLTSANPTVNSGNPIAVQLKSGTIVQAKTVILQEGAFIIESGLLGTLSLPAEHLQSLDFGGGRIRNLQDLTFDQSDSRSPDEKQPVLWFVSKNSPAGTRGKAPIKIGQTDYRRGLWLHSGANLRFRLNREYTQFKSVVGFDLTHVTSMPRINPRLRLVIQGDGKQLLSQEFNWNDPPSSIDVNVKDVRELVVQVQSLGKVPGVLEHFAFGDPQLLK